MTFLLFFAICIAIIAAVITYKNLKWGFFFYLILIPLMHKELFSMGYWDLLPIRLAAGGVFIGSLFHAYRWYKKTSKDDRITSIKKNLLSDYFLVLLVLLWLIRALSLLQSADLTSSVGLFMFYSSVLFMYVIYRVLIATTQKSFYKQVLALYIGIGIFTALFASVQYYLRLCCRQTIGGVWVIPNITPRLGSTFWDVNHYGGYLVTLIPLTAILFFVFKDKKKRILSLILTLLFGYMLFMTKSRSAWLGLGLGVLITLFILYSSKLKKPIIYGMFGILAASVLFIAVVAYKDIPVKQRVGEFMHYRLDSTDTHVMLLEGAGEIFVNNLVIGSGYGDFDDAFRETETAQDYFDREPKLREMKVPPHSVWGEVMAETGGPGIIVYALFIILLLASLITSIFTAKDEEEKYVGVGVLGSIISVLASGLFYSYNMEFYWMILFIGIGYSILSLGKRYSLSYVVKWWYDKPITPYLIIIPPTLFYIFLKLGTNTLIDWDEAIYAKVAKNILDTGDWLSLRWDNLEEYWFEKPPLYMWLSAIAFKFFGVNSFGARFASGVFGLFGVLLAYEFGKLLYNKLTGIFAAFILLSTVQYLYYSRNGMLDVTVTFFILATLYFFWKGLYATKPDKKAKAQESEGFLDKIIHFFSNPTVLFGLAGIMLGLGVMTKAIVGLLPIPIVFTYLFYHRVFLKQAIPYKNVVVSAVMFLIVAVPWHAYSVAVHGEAFYDKYFVDHMLGRGLSGFGHEKPVWWFLEVIKVSFRIWIFPLLGAIVALPFLDKKYRKEYVFLGISTIFVLFFFSVSKDKLQWYIMPIYPFLALLAARFMERCIVWFNQIIRNDLKLDNVMFRSAVLLIVVIVGMFYVVVMRERIYMSDANKDKVALVKIHNELYPIEEYPDRKLFVNGVAPPVLLFYSDHPLGTTNNEHMLRTIDEAAPDQSYVFFVPENLYYDVRDSQDKIDTPLVLDVKGAAGGWILVKSKTRVDLLKERLAVIKPELDLLFIASLEGTITPKEQIRYDELRNERGEIIAKLAEYGHPIVEKK